LENLLLRYFKIEDEYHLIEPVLSDFRQVISLQAKRDGSDLDGRQYTIKTLTQNLEGNIKKGVVTVVVPHDEDKR